MFLKFWQRWPNRKLSFSVRPLAAGTQQGDENIFNMISFNYTVIPASQMICQQVFTVSSKTANHLANTYPLEYK